MECVVDVTHFLSQVLTVTQAADLAHKMGRLAVEESNESPISPPSAPVQGSREGQAQQYSPQRRTMVANLGQKLLQLLQGARGTTCCDVGSSNVENQCFYGWRQVFQGSGYILEFKPAVRNDARGVRLTRVKVSVDMSDK